MSRSRISRDRNGALEIAGRSRQENGADTHPKLNARTAGVYWVPELRRLE
jgi:hypothetical protein